MGSDRASSRLIALSATALLVASWGCGNRPAVDTSTTEATVKGTITVDGKPVAKGRVGFDPSNVERKFASPRSTETDADGSYSLTTLVGANRISFSGKGFGKYQYTELKYDVKPGENTYNIVLPVPATTP